MGQPQGRSENLLFHVTFPSNVKQLMECEVATELGPNLQARQLQEQKVF